MAFDLTAVNVPKYDAILSRGLSNGLGIQGGQVCIEAAICETLGLGHYDDPKCVTNEIRSFKIGLNDSSAWESPKSRAKGLRDLGLAQLGSLGIVDGPYFLKLLNTKIISVLVPEFLNEMYPNREEFARIIHLCQHEITEDEAINKARALKTDDLWMLGYFQLANMDPAYGVSLIARAIRLRSNPPNPANGEKYLVLVANLALEVLRELKSPGVELLNK